MPSQSCPNCQKHHDVGIYVSGQRVRCSCGIHFDVRRNDVSMTGGRAVGSRVQTLPARKVTAQQAEGALAIGPAVPDESGLEKTAIRDSRSPEEEAAADDEETFVSAARPQIPGYDLVEILGRGGMGEVWRAVQRSLGRTVAVKLLPARLAKDPEFVARFDKEATALASLSHPNIIQIIDRGVAGEQFYFAMEYVDGQSLREVMNGGALPPQDALRICAQICRAIDYAHDKKIIHRDLKPENILLDERGHVKVADFGLAGIRGSEAPAHLTATSVAMGTVNYMAPEQRKDARSVDGRADLYSLGVVLYELLTGELPIGRFKLPSEKLPGLDARVDDIVARTLESDPDSRFQRASLVGSALEELIGSGIAAGPVAAPDRPAAAGALSTRPDRGSQSVIEHSWRGLKVFLIVVGGLAVLGAATILLTGRGNVTVQTPGGSVVTVGTQGEAGSEGKHGPSKVAPPNSYSDLFSGISEEVKDGRTRLSLSFAPGDEKFNAHAGTWTMADGVLTAVQVGNDTSGHPDGVPPKLVPRAYLAHRYFSVDDFTAEAQVTVKRVGHLYAVEEDAQRFGELALRIKDLQVSVFVIPGTGIRLMWRYYTPDGLEISGNSSRELTEDELAPPPDGTPIRLELRLKRNKAGVHVEAFANGIRFSQKTLPGLQGQIGKLALGCRNLECSFRDVAVSGKVASRPQPRAQP